MPTKKTWLLRVSEIRQDLLRLDVPVLDRQMVEKLFICVPAGPSR